MTSQELRANLAEVLAFVKNSSGNAEATLTAVSTAQMLAQYEIAAQLAEINERQRMERRERDVMDI